jgi:tetratricopeptide (TPR) repeat protein
VTGPVTGRGERLDPDALAALEEERDFLLRSLDDLARERDAGDIDDEDHRALTDDYTARAAAVIRAIERGSAAPVASPSPTSRRTRLLAAAAVALVAVVAGVVVVQSSGRRGTSGLTGRDVAAASSRVDDCVQLEQEGDADAALECYSEIVEAVPGNVAALTSRGWLQVREFDVADGIEDLDAAIALDPRATAPYVFRASARSRNGDPAGAVADLADFYANDPAEEERALADRFGAPITAAALDACIDGDVTGSMPAVEVLACYQDVLVVDADAAVAQVYLGWLLARTGVAEDALTLLDEGLENDPDLSAGYVFRAALRAHLGDRAGALADLDRFATFDAPEDQVDAAAQVRAAVETGEDPLER